MVSEAQRRANARYNKNNVVRKVVPLYPTDADLKEWLEARDEPFATYVKRLIRGDMERRANDGED